MSGQLRDAHARRGLIRIRKNAKDDFLLRAARR